MEILSRAILAAMAGGFVVTYIVPMVGHAFETFPLIARALGGH